MKSTRILAALVVAVAATVGGFYAGHLFTGSDTVAATPASGNAVEQLWKATPPGASGTAQPLAAYRGKPVVVNFWASWCGPCVKEMPTLSAMQRDYEKKGITFIGLGVDSEKNVNDFLKKVPVAYPVYVTGFGGADLARSFGNNAGGLPFTVVIDAKGQIRSTKLGEVDPAELKHTLDSL
ncbi:thioredoxin [Burkholderia sp. THE68]|jgi:thiol-disulfide isomerase/thioredoxin|uniref:TlpA family protein disulfide reductase n=1 Tax=Burkholderiaceae TaxID=119060 RepID=UPI00131764D0|nr:MULTISPECIES: TlpA disulfide reductase family protein [Burkholderiaceae]BBU28398.1 thioredoxin [Burkholderia sp. THE68]BCQ24211.1 redoxin family protein [Caballeronia sp. NK8]